MVRAPRESCDSATGTHDGGTLECAAVGVLSLFAHETRMSPPHPATPILLSIDRTTPASKRFSR
jgi:hypothetical protein